jgi:hypothetical protein
MLKVWAVIALLGAGGCTALKPAGPTTRAADRPPQQPTLSPTVKAAPRDPQRIVKAADPHVLIRPVVNLSIFQVSVPLGAVSRNEAFWKHVQEHVVDVSAHDILQKNGIRVGMASLADFEHFARILDRSWADARPMTYVAAGVKVVELTMKQAVPYQLIYDFDAKNNLTIRSYEDSDNIFVLEFQPVPRKAGDVRIGLCPMVRSLRKRLVAIGDVETRQIEYRNPEKLFDLNLRSELPLDSFLIIAPSAEAQSPMSLGHSFLVHEANTEKVEELLLIIPQAAKPKVEKPTEASAEDKRGLGIAE